MTKFVFAPKSVQVTATTTSQAVGVPVEDGLLNCAREVLVSASAEVYVKLATSGSVAATTNDILIQPGDSLRLQTSNCAFISVITASGTSRVSISGVSNGIGASCNTLDLTFMRDTLDSRITFTRASQATHFDSTGRLVVDGNNVARFDYDPVTLLPRGLLIEESRTNLILHSRDMTQAAWTKTDVTAARTQVGIDGAANTACLMTEGVLGTASTNQTATVTAGSTITGSVVLKRGNTDWVVGYVGNSPATNGVLFWVNLATGAKGVVTNIGTPTGVSVTVVNQGGGWYRLVCSCIPDGVYTVARLSLQSATADNSSTRVNNATYIVDCAQLEVGAFATPSVITTGAATATRAVDVNSSTAVMVGATGTVVIEAIAPPLIGTRVLYSFDDGTSSNQIVIYLNTGGVITCLWKVGGVAQAAINTATVTAGATFKLAFAWALNDFAVSLNGATVLTDTLGTVPTVTTRRIGMEVGNNNQWNSQIRALREYSTRLPNATLQALTV